MASYLKMRIFTWGFALAIGVLTPAPMAGVPAEELATREALIRSVSAVLLSSETPLALPDGSWKGFVLASSGTPLSPLLTSWEHQRYDLGNIGQQLEALKLYDQAMYVTGGVAFPVEVQLADTWKEVLSHSQPSIRILQEPSRSAARWLFRQEDAVDQLRGVSFLREPSDAFRRYAEYRALLQLILAAEVRHDAPWQLHPRLSNFASLAEARSSIVNEWEQFGFRREIEAAETELTSGEGAERWRVWSDAHLRMTTLSYRSNAGITVPRSVLFPSPELWYSMGSWITVHCDLGPTEGEYVLQIGRVAISRPWMQLDKLIRREILIRDGSGIQVSDGATPTLLSYPRGRLAVVPDELILVRRVKVTSAGKRADNSLSRIAFPDEINLLGYVVRALPQI